jgi:hypothetical protein
MSQQSNPADVLQPPLIFLLVAEDMKRLFANNILTDPEG